MTLVHLHVHDTFSAYDAVGHPAELAQRARELGQPALATTNHGSLRGLYAAAVACREVGIKYIAGVEAYVCDDAEQRGLTKEDRAEVLARFPDDPATGKAEVARLQAERKERDHITLWAMTDEGLRNLFRLMAWAWNEGFYYRPRVDMQRLRQWSAGIAASTGCPGGVVTSPLRRGDLRTAVDRASELADIFGDRLYCELMPHVPEDGDRLYAQKLLRIAERVGAKVIATGDVHYPLPADAVAQDALLCIHQKKRVDDLGRQKFDGSDYWMTSREELAGQLRRAHPWMKSAAVEAALDETLSFAERCTANVVKVQPGVFLAGPPVPQDGSLHVDHQDWLVHVCCDAAQASGLLGQRAYEERLNHELRVIGDYGFAPYLMMVAEVRKWARENGVMCGPGRGSSAGSLVCMLLGITDIDPIRYDLSFDRFIEHGREPPDVDLDHDPDGADRLEEHLRGLYGDERVVGISTFTMLGGKSTLRDMARVHGVPERELTPLLELIDDGSEEEEGTGLVDVLESTTEGRAFAERYPDVAGCVARLEGNMRAAGRHPGGLIISSVPVVDVAPVETRAKAKARIPVLAYDMRAAEQIGFVKLDNLRLSVLELLKRFRERTGIDPRGFDFENKEVLSAFTAGRLAGIFQFDTPSARRLCSGFEFFAFDDVALINALNRPGPKRSGLVEHCLECHRDPFAVESVHPIWDAVFSGTYSVPVYQEQLIALARQMAGYTPEEAAQFRRKIAKSKGLSDEANKFIDGAVANGVPSALATDIFERVVGFGRYCFNKSHSYSYAGLAVWMMAAKLAAPGEFYRAALEVEQDEKARLSLVAEARRAGIPVRAPSVTMPAGGMRSNEQRGEILASLTELKGVGNASLDVLCAVPPKSLRELAAFRSPRLNGSVFGVLARANAIRDLEGVQHHRFFAVNHQVIWRMLSKGRVPVLADGVLPEFTPGEAAAEIEKLWPLYVDDDGASAIDHAAATLRGRMPFPVRVLGDPMLDVPGMNFVVARLAERRVFPDGGRVSGRLVLTSADGQLHQVKVDADVLDAMKGDELADGDTLFLVVHRGERGGGIAEAVWRVTAAPDWLRTVPQSRPQDPVAAVSKLAKYASVRLNGLRVLRIFRTRDKNGGPLVNFGLLGKRSYLRAYVFARNVGGLDPVQVGAMVNVVGEGLGGAVVSVRQLEVL